MASIHLTEHARDDLLAIWRYVAEQDLDAADRLISALEEHYRSLATLPRQGRSHRELGSGIYSLLLRPFRIFYLLRSDAVIILRIYHSARDPKGVLEE